MINKDRVFNSYFYFTRNTFTVSPPATPSFDKQKQLVAAGTGIQFRIFSILWAIAALFHMAHSSVFDTQLNFALLTLSALYVIFRPSLISLTFLIVLQIFDALYRMPFTTNHWIFTAFVNLTIVHAILYHIIKQRSFHTSEGKLLDTFAPVVRIELIILYFFAVFHKLNSGFFSPAASCATDLLEAQHLDAFINLTPQLIASNAYFTILIELLIPVFLCFKSLRNIGILVGLFFHCILSYSTYNAFYDFSSMVFAVYFLFASPAFSEKILTITRAIRDKYTAATRGYNLIKLSLILAAFIVSLVIIWALNTRLNTFRTVHLYFFWTIYSLLFSYCFISFMLSRQSTPKLSFISFSVPHWSFIILPIIVFINGICPYLGLKTENSYSMFSNLKTEGGVSNHYIVPASVQIFNYQKDVVEIISSTDPCLQKLGRENKALVLFEFSNYIRDHKPQRVEYLLNGRKEIYPLHPVKENPYVLSKLMKFRTFNTSGAQPCEH